MDKEKELKAKHPKEVAILLEIYKRSITHIEGYEKLSWATSFQISEAIEAMGIFADQETESLRQESEDRIVKTRAEHFKEMVTAQQKIFELEKEIDELKFNPETQRLAILCQNRNEQIQSLSARVSELEDFIGEIYNNPEYDTALLMKCRSLLTSPQGG